MTIKAEIEAWVRGFDPKEYSHVIIACDTFDWEDYPVGVKRGEDAVERVCELDGNNMQTVMEVYNLDMDIAAQLNEGRAKHITTVRSAGT